MISIPAIAKFFFGNSNGCYPSCTPRRLLTRRLLLLEEGGSYSAAAAPRLLQSLHAPSCQRATPTPTPTPSCLALPPAPAPPSRPATAVPPNHAQPSPRAPPHIIQATLPLPPCLSPRRTLPLLSNSGVAQCFKSTNPPPRFASAVLPGLEQRLRARPASNSCSL